MRRDGGFSLVELVLVVGILALALSIAAPNLAGRTPKYALRAAAREVGATIQLARQQAALEGQPYGIRYQVREGVYTLLLPGASGAAPDSDTLRPRRLDPEVRFEAIVTADNESHDGGEVDVEFAPTGAGGSHIVVLANSREERLWVKFHAVVGTLSFSGEPLEWHEYER